MNIVFYTAGFMAHNCHPNRILMETDRITSNLPLLPYQRSGHSLTENETFVVYNREKSP